MGSRIARLDRSALLRASVQIIPGTDNTRDLGGYPTESGGVIRPGMLFRAEALAHPSPHTVRLANWSADNIGHYAALRLATVIDLRGEDEVVVAPSAWAEASGARLVRIPIIEGGEGDETDFVRQLRAGTLRAFSAADLADFYATMIRVRAPLFGQAVAELAAPNALPALVHCTAGKDRTGLLVALLLEVLGVARDLVVADYALTGILRPDRVSAYADILAANSIEPAAVSALFETPADAMRLLLEELDAEFGSVEQFLLDAAGVTPATIEALRAHLLEPATP